MAKKTKKIILLAAILLMIGVLSFTQLPKDPDPFLSDKQVIKRINSFFSEAQPKIIQDRIFLDDTHVFVPFISEDDGYGMSFWIWKNNKWRAASVNEGGEPQVWNGEKKSKIIWNINPKDEVGEIRFFLKKEREFMVADGVDTYQPGMEMMHRITLQEKMYGVEEYPDHWQELMTQYAKIQAKDGQNEFLALGDGLQVFTGFYDAKGKETFPQTSFTGNGYSTGDDFVDVPFLVQVHENELEGEY
ncbi:hypothetical protein [Bacillus sp. mrc49]|uniref:hypothetical protein n=2 Tax=Bacillus sp. mrc49 TaxID=2054913 RepID=UPI000C27A448|nr:hypothetical protein [Bacillus sp. mrc49]PJN86592.1 hypothetical protein CVN76_26315 [Bacillus sp. mrc49]